MTAAAAPEGAASRRDGAAARLYVDYRDRIYRFCLSRLRSREEAEDAVQNVFVRVHMALDRGVVPQYEAAWLYKIAHNVCLSRAESRARRACVEALSPFDDELPVAAPEVSREELAGLNEALEAMPHNLRTAVLLREWQGLSYAEIADAMGLSVAAVETLLFRGRRHLANALEQGTGTKPKTVALRVLDLLGLGWLRELIAGAGPAAQVVTGAALLAVGGGGAAIELTTDAHSRPSQSQPPAAVVAPAAALTAFTPFAPIVQHGRVTATPASTSAPLVSAHARASTTPAPHTDAVSPRTTAIRVRPQPRATATTTGSDSATTTHATSPAPAPELTPATVPIPTASVPTVGVPSVDVPTVSVPTVSVPAVLVPAGSGGVGLGK